MTPITHVYVTYIAASPERIWQSLTDGETARRYWNGTIISDWKSGSDWRLQRNRTTDPPRIGGTIREFTPPRRLVMSWKVLADGGSDDESQVVFEIEPQPHSVRLTVTHSELSPTMAGQVNGGWPRVLAALKTLLETGRELEIWTENSCGPAAHAPAASHARV